MDNWFLLILLVLDLYAFTLAAGVVWPSGEKAWVQKNGFQRMFAVLVVLFCVILHGITVALVWGTVMRGIGGAQ